MIITLRFFEFSKISRRRRRDAASPSLRFSTIVSALKEITLKSVSRGLLIGHGSSMTPRGAEWSFQY